MDALDWGKHNDQILFLALDGLRWSEAVVITEDDIQDAYVAVNKSAYRATQSRSSNRKIPYIGYQTHAEDGQSPEERSQEVLSDCVLVRKNLCVSRKTTACSCHDCSKTASAF